MTVIGHRIGGTVSRSQKPQPTPFAQNSARTTGLLTMDLGVAVGQCYYPDISTHYDCVREHPAHRH